jgi:hypothetical protein
VWNKTLVKKEQRLLRRNKLNFNEEQSYKLWGTKISGSWNRKRSAQENNFLCRRNKPNLNAKQNCRIKETSGHETKRVHKRNKTSMKEQINFKCGIKL